MSSLPRDQILLTPPVPELVPTGVFDAFAWSPPTTLGWRSGANVPSRREPLTAANPGGMVFLFLEECSFLPSELAILHVPALLRPDETERRVLAPYAIDDATDLLYEQRKTPARTLALATDSLAGLFWGLHDWAHFHHHGPFEARGWTELQCDAAAIAWLWINRGALALEPREHHALVETAHELTRQRFADESDAASGELASRRLDDFVQRLPGVA